MVAKIEDTVFLLQLKDVEIVGQRFRITKEQRSPWLQHLQQITVQFAACWRVEVDRHIAQQNDVNLWQELLFYNVSAVKRDFFTDRIMQTILIACTGKVALLDKRFDATKRVAGIIAISGFGQDRRVNVTTVDFDPPRHVIVIFFMQLDRQRVSFFP